MPALVRALNRVDLPTLGRPTMPHLRLMGSFQGSNLRNPVLYLCSPSKTANARLKRTNERQIRLVDEGGELVAQPSALVHRLLPGKYPRVVVQAEVLQIAA